MNTQLNVLLLCDLAIPGSNANALFDHVSSFVRYSEHNVYVASGLAGLTTEIGLDQFDVVIIHYSVCLLGEQYLNADDRARLKKTKAKKALFIQDEYREIFQICTRIKEIDFDFIFTCMPEGLRELVYPEHVLPKVKLVHTLTGYVPEKLLDIEAPRIADRTIDFFYRGRTLPFWLGRVAQEKAEIGQQMAYALAGRKGIHQDIKVDESDRVYGVEWVRRLTNCKITLGVESAASMLDFTGVIQKDVEAYCARNLDADFDQVERNVFPGLDQKISTAQLSPRLLEAAATRTGMILLKGEYSGYFEEGRHYIGLEKDYSNIEEVIALATDDEFVQKMVDTAYEEIACNPELSFKAMVATFDSTMNAAFARSRRRTQFTPPEAFLNERSPKVHAVIGRFHGNILCKVDDVFYSAFTAADYVKGYMLGETELAQYTNIAIKGEELPELQQEESVEQVVPQYKFRDRLQLKLRKYWAALPEGARNILRPVILKFIR